MEILLLFAVAVVVVLIAAPDLREWICDQLDEIFGDDNWPSGGRSTLTP